MSQIFLHLAVRHLHNHDYKLTETESQISVEMLPWAIHKTFSLKKGAKKFGQQLNVQLKNPLQVSRLLCIFVIFIMRSMQIVQKLCDMY
jgi:hypothetical protein